jgi:prepilin-type N-terminal cleavage/methylation domain-containing protein
MKRRSGFTVLELLIVIAIIGLLASVVLVAVNSSRGAAVDASIKQTLSSLRAQGVLYYDSHNQSYCDPVPCDSGAISLGSCSVLNSVFWDDSSNMHSINPGIVSASFAYDPIDGNGALCSLEENGERWSVQHELKVGGFWCVDSVGNSKAGQDADGDAECD